MSSFIYDPHQIRQKPNRYFQRKGQIIRARNNTEKNQAISKEDAAKYINAIKIYFPHLFVPPTIPEPILYMQKASSLILNNTPKGSFILSISEFQDIDAVSYGYVLLVTKNQTVPNTLTLTQARSYSWFGNIESTTANDSYPIQLVYSIEGVIANIDSSRPTQVLKYNNNWQHETITIDSTYNLFVYYYNNTQSKLLLNNENKLANIYID